MTPLINHVDIGKYKPIAKDIPPDRLGASILEAQVIDLESILGAALYNDFMADPTVAKYQDLLKGKDYQLNGVTIHFEGLIPMLSYFALARFTTSNQGSWTSFGVVKKRSEQSEPMNGQEISSLASELRAIGLAYGEKVKQFLQANPTVYPLYNGHGNGLNSLSVKFFDV